MRSSRESSAVGIPVLQGREDVNSVSHPVYVGTAKIKAEFWRTAPAYPEQYPTQLRTPQISSAHPGAGVPSPAHASIDLLSVSSNPVPAATLETAYADKLVAFATRPHLKWRDLYDLWWIGTQTPAQLDVDAVCEQFLHNITAYTPLQGLPPHQALSLFLQRPVPEIIRQADPDLRNWLPARLWQRLQGQGVQQMVDYVRQSIAYVSAYLDGQDDERLQGVDLKTLSRRQEPGMRP